MGLETMLFGVSGSCDDMDATSLPVEFEPGPPSEKLTCGTHQAAVRNIWIQPLGVRGGRCLEMHWSWSAER